MPLEMRNPWIGSRFDGLLILGESHYGDADNIDLTTQVVGEIVDRTFRHAFFTRVEIVVTGEDSQKSGNDSFWHTVAFANFCPGAVEGPRQRPSLEMWSEGYRLFPQILSRLKPTRILVLGNDTWDNIGSLTDTVILPSPKKSREAGRLDAGAGISGEGVPITSIRHPASFGFSARDWHGFFQEFLLRLPSR